jgi:hypothetical protein
MLQSVFQTERFRTAAPAEMMQSFIHADRLQTEATAEVIRSTFDADRLSRAATPEVIHTTFHTDGLRTVAKASDKNPVCKNSVQIHLKCVSSYRLLLWQISLWNLHSMHSVVFHIFFVRYAQEGQSTHQHICKDKIYTNVSKIGFCLL